MNRLWCAALLAAAATQARPAPAPVTVTVTVSTGHYDNSRNSVNDHEAVLTPANVARLARLGQFDLDGPVMGQPLFIPNVTVRGRRYNVVISATMNNTVYALDADSRGAAPLWKTNVGLNWGQYPVPMIFYNRNVGILSTPVVDVAAGFVYVVSVSPTPTFTLRKLNLATGAQVASVDIKGSVPGKGAAVPGKNDDVAGGRVQFHAAWASQRAELTLANGQVYVAFASGDEDAIWHGWVFAYNATTLGQTAALCLSPNGIGAGVWGGGGGAAVDANGNLYFGTGNGTWDGKTNFGQSIVKTNASLVIQDWFTPSDYAKTNIVDADVSSGRVMLVPDSTYLTFGSKDGRFWVLDSTNMGHLQGMFSGPQPLVVEKFVARSETGIFGGLFSGGAAYFPIAGKPLYAFAYDRGAYKPAPLAKTAESFAQMALAASSNTGANGLVWAVTADQSPFATPRQATLRAFDPRTLREYWNSGPLGTLAKFASPTVANGRVYVATYQNQVVVFGLPASK